jgi:hypothetical protein
LQQTHIVIKRGDIGQEITAEFFLSVALSYLKGSSIWCKNLRNGTDGFNSPMKVVVLWTFSMLKNPLISAGFEPANFGYNGKHDNHYTTENDSDDTYFSSV